MRQTADLVENLLCWGEMLLNGDHERRENILVEEHNAFEVELWTEQVEEHVLTVTLVHL